MGVLDRLGLASLFRRSDPGAGLPARGAYGDTSWNAASRDHELKGWHPGLGSADTDNMFEMDEIRARARDLDRNEGLATSAIETQATWINGAGLNYIADPDWQALGKSKQWADDWSREVTAKGRAYLNSTDVDATRIDTFGPLSHLALSSKLVNGGFVALPLMLSSGRTAYETAIQLVEVDRLSNPGGTENTDRLRDGVELDENGAPLAYNIEVGHPGDALYGLGGAKREWVRVETHTPWGRRRVLHPYDRRRIGQTRGVSLLASVLPEFHLIGRYKQAEVQAAVANALVALIVNTNLTHEEAKGLFDSPEEYLKYRRDNAPKLKSGAALMMPVGTTASAFTPARPNAGYDAFHKSILREVFAGIGMPYEVGAKDFAGMNYSNARTALNEAWRYALVGRDRWTRCWNAPVAELWFEEAVHLGEIPDCTPDDLMRTPAAWGAWTRSRWIGAGRGYVDPEKEAKAAKLRMEAGLSTLEMECAEQGLDWRDLADQLHTERTYLARYSIRHPGDPVPPPAAPGAAPPAGDKGDAAKGDAPDRENESEHEDGEERDAA